ncbi:MAG: hypothetical protein NC548_06260 [Lachnospiraceae bacterium]|nr:hypothetical protein [Lachnospiraceae bacterium]
MTIYKVRVRSFGKRTKPIYTDDYRLPIHAMMHFEKFVNALTNKYHHWGKLFTFSYQRGVTKHAKCGYIQIKAVKDRQTPTATEKIYLTLLPYFLRDIKWVLRSSSLANAQKDSRINYQILLNFDKDEFTLIEPNSAICMTIDEGIQYVYKKWVEDPDYFYKFGRILETS